MLFDIGWPELMVIGVIALVVIGPKDMPRALRIAGYWMRKARTMSREFQNSIDQMIREAELEEVREDLKKATDFNIEDEIHKTVDADGSLSEAVKPPEIPDHFDHSTEGSEAAPGEPAAGEPAVGESAGGEPAGGDGASLPERAGATATDSAAAPNGNVTPEEVTSGEVTSGAANPPAAETPPEPAAKSPAKSPAKTPGTSHDEPSAPAERATSAKS